MTRNIVAEKYWLVEFVTMNVKLQNEIQEVVTWLPHEHSPNHHITWPTCRLENRIQPYLQGR